MTESSHTTVAAGRIARTLREAQQQRRAAEPLAPRVLTPPLSTDEPAHWILRALAGADALAEAAIPLAAAFALGVIAGMLLL